MAFIDAAQHALLAAGPGAALYGRSAARLHGLDFEEDDRIYLVVPWGANPRVPDHVVVRATQACGRRPLMTTPLPHTDVIDTVLDLSDRTDAGTCIFWLTEAGRRGLLDVDELDRSLRGRLRHRHRGLVNDILDDLRSGVTSNLEVRYSRDVERAHSLPRSVRQFVVPASGHRADFAYPELRLLIEVDGLAFHQGDAAERDARLDADHARAGWTTLRFTWDDVTVTPCLVAQQVAALVTGRGCPVDLTPCRREQ